MNQQQQQRSRARRGGGGGRMEQKEEVVDEPWQQIRYLKEECDAINVENTKLFRQQTLYDEDFVNFMNHIYNADSVRESGNPNMIKVLMRFVFNVVPVKVSSTKEIKWWW